MTDNSSIQKQCKYCAEVKPLTEFYLLKRARDGHMGYCKDCHYIRNVMSDKGKATSKRSNQRYLKTERGKASRIRINLLHRYGLTSAQFDLLLKAQDGVCAICHNPPKRRTLCIDHDHITGAVRGLLCGPCNSILGRWKDSPDTAERAKQYLLRHSQLRLAV